MATIQLPRDFKEFLRLLNEHHIEYLIVGGYAVSYHGFPRTTGDLDIWVDSNQETAAKLVLVLNKFGFGATSPTPDLFLKPGNIVRMGVPPLRLEIMTAISGIQFSEAYARRVVETFDNEPANVISLSDLRINKRAAGRLKDLNDLENLPE